MITWVMSGSSALLHSHGIPAPHMQPNSSLQARSGWFSHTHPMPKHTGQFLSMNARPPLQRSRASRARPHCPSWPSKTIRTFESCSGRNESIASLLNPVVYGVAYMTPAERINKAFDDAHVVIADYLEPGPRNAEETLNQLISIIDDHERYDALVQH